LTPTIRVSPARPVEGPWRKMAVDTLSARWVANPATRRLTAPDSGGSAPAAGRSRERLLGDSCGRRGVSSPRRILCTSCSRTCGLTRSRWPPASWSKHLAKTEG
jgi:hypothetical protein